jgi:hypothetical protein
VRDLDPLMYSAVGCIAVAMWAPGIAIVNGEWATIWVVVFTAFAYALMLAYAVRGLVRWATRIHS